ncbi:MAG: hypothetical protein B1H08_05985 [Candidatus Omnitrophica bacterium 4484_171]|nr:MAG: hypothetical protein B1H08_05985 [Candidatus Omnitrophica bacterium 4484_171]
MWEKILVVDDDIDARDRFYEILSRLSYNVSCVPTASEALARLLEERYNLIILDEKMPKADGYETAERIRQFDKETKIVILTEGELSSIDKESASSLGVNTVIKKDFSNHFMIKSILEALKSANPGNKIDSRGSLERVTIMVVDDNPDVRGVLETFLSKKGHRVVIASSGEDALMKVKVDKPDIVFLDLRMPGMDGLMVLKAIKQFDETIDVVMLTSSQDSFIMDEAKRLGACDYLIKPYDLEKLDTLITSLSVKG